MPRIVPGQCELDHGHGGRHTLLLAPHPSQQLINSSYLGNYLDNCSFTVSDAGLTEGSMCMPCVPSALGLVAAHVGQCLVVGLVIVALGAAC